MSRRFFTSDWHLNQSLVLKYSHRPFKNIEQMAKQLIIGANQRAKIDDLIIHVGDFYCYGSDHGSEAIKIHPSIYMKQIAANFINIKGNHDGSNKCLNAANYLITNIGPYKGVLVYHYPSNDVKFLLNSRKSCINICGHVHNSWKYFYDESKDILNINVGVDQWKYNIVSEEELVEFIRQLAIKDEKICNLIMKRTSDRDRKFYIDNKINK